jgi:hypothetical protein
MNIKDLQPASNFAKRYGVKAIIYGQAGTGKTPMMNTAPRPVLLAVEPGLRSMSNSNIPTFFADTKKRIDEFFEWFFKSAEAKQFDSLGIDSGSEIAEVVLKELMPKISHGQKLYGEMAKTVDEWITDLYYLENKHVFLICKETRAESGKSLVNNNGVISVEVQYQSKPYFPGNQLNVIVPHKYDEILQAAHVNIPGVGNTVALRTKGTPEVYARDRSGKLNELEPPNLAAIVQKCMSQ